MNKRLNRRTFLKHSGIGIAASALAASPIPALGDAAFPHDCFPNPKNVEGDYNIAYQILIHNIFPVPSEHTSWEPGSDGVVLYNTKVAIGGSDITLNDTASTIWQLCDGKRNIYDIIHAMSTIYRIPEDTCDDSTVSLLDYLFKNGYIEYTWNDQIIHS